MFTINRSAIVVMPAQPFLDWLHQVDPTSVKLTLEDLRREPTIYLLPECENDVAARRYLRNGCGNNFEEQLQWLVPRAVGLACPQGPRYLCSLV
jgi:hypothetical protein